jgi:hypothetical protein
MPAIFLFFEAAQIVPPPKKDAESVVAVEKGTKAVICVNFSACGKRRFNNLRANFAVEFP